MTSSEQEVRRKRLLVPVKDERTEERFCHWLAANAQFWNAEIRLFSIVEPLWFRSIPYTAAQAHQLLNEQAHITAQLRQALAIYSQEIRNRYRGICLTSDVSEGPVNANTILNYARSWPTDCILLLCSRQGVWSELLRFSLAMQILRSAECLVHVVQTPEQPTRARLIANLTEIVRFG